MGKSHKKPTGNLSLNKLTFNKNEKIQISFPNAKNDQEIQIVELFIKLINQSKLTDFKFEGYQQNREQDLDFTIISNQGKSLLELTELIPTDNMKGGYTNINPLVNQQALVNRLISIVEKKSQKYVGIKMPIDLLVYITDNNSNVSMSAEVFLKNHFNRNSHVFRNIFYFIPLLQIQDGIIIQYYPSEEHGENTNELGNALNLDLG